VIDRLGWRHTPVETRAMTSRNRIVRVLFASLCLSATACDVRQVTLADEQGNQGNESNEQVVEPTGQACEVQDEAAACSDGSSAYCGWIENAQEYGPCIPDDELECEPGTMEPTFSDELCGQMYRRCLVEGGVPTWVNDICDTPLVLRFDAQPIELIAAESTPMATFDISMQANSCITTDWPSAATPWLAIDLDGNGSIDGGDELFGSGSRMADGSHARHGFMALAELDADANGKLDASDPRFAELRMWRDHDADRRSLPGELEALASAGITSIPVTWTSAIECDERGNCANQRASFEHAGGVGEVVDVYLACH